MEIEKQLKTADDDAVAPRQSRAPGAGALRQIVAEIEGVLDEWTGRVQRVLDRCRDAVEREADTRRLIADLEAEDSRWEAQRQRERRQMEEEAQRLAEAWLRVEAEQRRLLQAQESLQLQARGGGETGRAMTPEPIEVNPAVVSPWRTASGATEGPARSEDAASPSRELVVRQFEQLRREIGKHTRDTR